MMAITKCTLKIGDHVFHEDYPNEVGVVISIDEVEHWDCTDEGMEYTYLTYYANVQFDKGIVRDKDYRWEVIK